MTETTENKMISAVLKVLGSTGECEAMLGAVSEGIIEGAIHSMLDKIITEKVFEVTEGRIKTVIEVVIDMISKEVAEDIISRDIEGITKEKVEEMFTNIRKRLQTRFQDTPRAIMDDLSGRTEARYREAVAQLLAKGRNY